MTKILLNAVGSRNEVWSLESRCLSLPLVTSQQFYHNQLTDLLSKNTFFSELQDSTISKQYKKIDQLRSQYGVDQ